MNLVVTGEFVCRVPECEARAAYPEAAGWSMIIWETDAGHPVAYSGWWCRECGDALVAELDRQGYRRTVRGSG